MIPGSEPGLDRTDWDGGEGHLVPRLEAEHEPTRRPRYETQHRPGIGSALEAGFARQLRCLPDPTHHELLVELFVLVDVEVAHFLLLGLPGAAGGHFFGAGTC